MISVKITHTAFTGITMVDMTRTSRRHNFLSVRRSKSEDGSDPDPAPIQGDPKSQDLLAKIAMLQTEKVRLTDFLDERSAYLTQFAEEANAEFDAIGENALKELEESTSRIMGNIESRMQEFEDSTRQSYLEIEEGDKELTEFEGEVENSRNEGMFFKSFTKKEPAADFDIEKAKEEAKRMSSELIKQSAGSKTRINLYVALIGVVTIAISDSVFASPVQDWKKIGVLGVILVGLVSQFIYERSIQSDAEKKQGSGSSDKEDN